MKEYKAHPAAKLFPMLENSDMQELVADIKKNGLLHSIILLDGQILDGRNRYVACGMAGIDPHFEKFSGLCSPTEYVWAVNGKRRHMTKSQLSVVAANMLPLLEAEAKERQLSTLKHNTDKEKIPERDKGQARDKAAAIVGVNPRYVSDAKKIKEEAPEIFERVASGEVTISAAKKEMAKKKPRKSPGNFEQWRKFKSVCVAIEKQLSELAELTVDRDHVPDAINIAENLSRKLTQVIKSINK